MLLSPPIKPYLYDMRFSQRIGKTPVRDTLQVESINQSLNNRLWNIILEHFFYQYNDDGEDGVSNREMVCKILWVDFYNERIDLIPNTMYRDISSHGVIDYIKEWYFKKAKWHDKYDLIEFICSLKLVVVDDFTRFINNTLRKEVAGYRIVDKQIVQITSEEEIESIEEALQNSSVLTSVNTHLTKALEMLSNRESPDYRNSIKESISAVEAFCKVILKEEKATLGKALATFERHNNLHPSLKEAYSKIYGYTSDAGGIRHAILEDGLPIEFEDAKFMLVSCSAFINYLKAKIKI